MTDHETAPELTPEVRAADEALAVRYAEMLAIAASDDHSKLDKAVENIEEGIRALHIALLAAPVQSGTTEGLDLSQFEGFTPGPWRAVQHDHAEDEAWWTVMFGAWDVSHNRAALPETVASSKYSAMTPQENAANAKLIAAAPLLLDEVKRLRAETAALRSLSPSIAPAPGTQPSAASTALSAIEKSGQPGDESAHNSLSRDLSGHSWVADDPTKITLPTTFAERLLNEWIVISRAVEETK